MRVLLAIDEFEGPVAGTESQFWKLLTGLGMQGLDVGVILLKPSKYLANNRPDIPQRVINITRLKSLKAQLRACSAARWARREGYELVHTFLNDTSVLLPWVMRLVNIPVIISRRDEGYWYTPTILMALRFNRRWVDAVVANSEAVARAVTRNEGYTEDKIRVIYNGVECTVNDGSLESSRRQLGIPAGAFAVGTLANLRPLKRVSDLIRAFAVLAPKCPSAILLVGGADRHGVHCDSHLAELKQLATQLEVLHRIRFHGHVSDVAQFIESCDVGALCSETEGMSNSIMQFMAAGKPVVATATGGNPELVKDQVTGLLVDIGDHEGIASCLMQMQASHSLRQKMGEAGRRRMATEFSIVSMLNKHLALYREIVR